MRKASVVIAIVAFVLLACSMVKADVIRSDGFESGNFSAWTSAGGGWAISGGSTHSGSVRTQIYGPCGSEAGILLLAKSSFGYKDLSLDYWYKTTSDALDASDHIYVEWSSDSGTSWQQLADYTSTSTSPWQEASFALPSGANDNPLFQFRLRASLSSQSDAMWFDDFALSGQPIPEPASMAVLLPFFFSLIARRFRRKQKVPHNAGLFFYISYTNYVKKCKI